MVLMFVDDAELVAAWIGGVVAAAGMIIGAGQYVDGELHKNMSLLSLLSIHKSKARCFEI